jgi:hypothetical protein
MAKNGLETTCLLDLLPTTPQPEATEYGQGAEGQEEARRLGNGSHLRGTANSDHIIRTRQGDYCLIR